MINHRGTAERLLRELLDESTLDRDKALRSVTAALCDAYEAGRTIEQQRVRTALLTSAGLR